MSPSVALQKLLHRLVLCGALGQADLFQIMNSVMEDIRFLAGEKTENETAFVLMPDENETSENCITAAENGEENEAAASICFRAGKKGFWH